MLKRKRGGTPINKATGGPASSNSNSNNNEEKEEESYPHLHALLSLQVPTCCIQMCDSSGLDLIALPQCGCATTLASMHVDIAGLPTPPAEDTASSTDSVAIFLKRLAKSQPCSSSTKKGFTTRKQPTRVFKKLAMCRPCLANWSKCSEDVQTYDYNDDPGNNETKYSVDVKCPQCGTRFTPRAVQKLLGSARTSTGSGTRGSSSGESAARACHGSTENAEWEECVKKTMDIVSWRNELKKWAKNELQHSQNDAASSSSSSASLSEQLSSDEIQLRDALLSTVQGSDSGEGPVHRQEAKRYELREYLMAKDERYRQDVEGEEVARALHDKIRGEAEAKEEEDKRRLEEDERMARELAKEEEDEKKKASPSSSGHAGATMTDHDRAEQEKKSEEAARILYEQLIKQDEEEKRLREEKDAAFARALHENEKEEKRQRKRKQSSVSPGGTVRKSPFDGGTTDTKSRESSVAKDGAPNRNSSSSSRVGVPNDAGVLVPDQANDKNEGDNAVTRKKSSNATRSPVREEANIVYGIESSDDDGDEKIVPVSSQAISSPQSGASPSLASSTASPAASAKAVTGTQVTKPSSLPFDGKDDTADTAPVNDEKQSWGDENEGHVDMLEAMGFDRDEARLRYIDACRDVERAASMLLSALEARQSAKEEAAKKTPQLSS